MKCSWNKSYEKYIAATSTSNNIYIIETINYTINYKFNLPFKCYGIQWIPKQSVYMYLYIIIIEFIYCWNSFWRNFKI